MSIPFLSRAGIAGMVLVGAAARAALAVEINVNLPGDKIGTGTAAPGAFVANFYQFALLMSGILAFGAVVYGGIKYATGRGNPSAESEGKSWITNALLGLLLLAGAWIVLSTINPAILNLRLPELPAISSDKGVSAPPAPTGVTCPGSSGKVCYPPEICIPAYGLPGAYTCG